MSANKFKMSDGSHGMLKGQANPDAFQKVNPNMPRRSNFDTEHERMAVKPQKTHANSTGFTNDCADLALDMTMEKAIADKLHQSMTEGLEDGLRAREEEDEERKANIVSEEQIDAAADSKNADDDDLEALRQRRRAQMKEMFDKKQKYRELGHGTYDEIEEEAFLKTVTASPRCIVHFYHKNFEKCKVMDMHLRKCARFFLGTRFVTLDAEKSPFFIEKLKVKTLPCAVVFVDGVAKGRQVGFDGLTNGGDEFQTVLLAWRLHEMEGLEEDFGPEDDIQWV